MAWYIIGSVMSYFFFMMLLRKGEMHVLLHWLILVILSISWIVSVPLLLGLVFSELLYDNEEK